MKKFIIFILVLLSIGALYYYPSRDFLLQTKYDLTHNNPNVNEQESIENILNQFQQIPYAEMEKQYLKNTQQDIAPFNKMLNKAVYYKIPRKDIYQKITGNFRIKDYLPKDDYYKQSLYSKKDSLYWLMDEKLLFQVLAFQNKLKQDGHDPNAFIITNGYRHPAFNKKVKGASQSRHIVGEAVDITAKDINQDGEINQIDKKIILETAEFVVGNSGGVGKYPNTLSIHMDTRGHKARWDSF